MAQEWLDSFSDADVVDEMFSEPDFSGAVNVLATEYKHILSWQAAPFRDGVLRADHVRREECCKDGL
eukprot:8408259-Pyramimonas_sp.AAC.1